MTESPGAAVCLPHLLGEGCGGGLTWDAEQSLTSVGARRAPLGACPAGLGVDSGLEFPAV